MAPSIADCRQAADSGLLVHVVSCQSADWLLCPAAPCLSVWSHPCTLIGSCTCSTKLGPAVEELKNQGNRAFFEHKNHDAVERYSAALRRAPHSALLLTNRWVTACFPLSAVLVQPAWSGGPV